MTGAGATMHVIMGYSEPDVEMVNRIILRHSQYPSIVDESGE